MNIDFSLISPLCSPTYCGHPHFGSVEIKNIQAKAKAQPKVAKGAKAAKGVTANAAKGATAKAKAKREIRPDSDLSDKELARRKANRIQSAAYHKKRSQCLAAGMTWEQSRKQVARSLHIKSIFYFIVNSLSFKAPTILQLVCNIFLL